MAHREGIREFLKDVDLTGKHVVDWGCGTKPIKNHLKGAASYFGIDKLDTVGADMVADICNPIMLTRFFDVAFCLEVLEHADYSGSVIKNIRQNLRPGGELYISVPFLFPTHSEHDLWRFTDQGIRLLLERNGFEIQSIKPTTDDQQGWICHAVEKSVAQKEQV